MRAALYESFGGPIRIVDVPEPSCPADGIVVDVRASGICRSDWHAWQGHDAMVSLPHVPGHEFAGVVVAVGDRIRTLAPGDRVIVPFVLGCGACARCNAGDRNICDDQFQPGFSGWGSFAEFVAVPRADGNVQRLPASVTFDRAASLGCRMATAYRAVAVQGEVTADSTVAVWGCGGVGLSAVMIASALGATVYAIDINPRALDLARSVGADVVLDSTSVEDAPGTIVDATGGGVDVSFDALGSPATTASSMLSLRKRGRHVQVGLLVGTEDPGDIPLWRLHADEIELFGSHGLEPRRYPELLALVESATVDPGALITGSVTLSEGARRLMQMADFPGEGIVVIEDFTS